MTTHRYRPVSTLRAVLVMLLASSAASVQAAEPIEPDALAGHGGVATIDENVGSASQEIPLELPDYHGLTPRLSLRYNSGGGNGYVGVGWSLSGFGGLVVRGAPGRWGSPRFDASDTFTLDGALLIPCSRLDTRVPSCEADANDGNSSHVYYATQIEGYRVIYFDRSTNSGWGSWVVLSKDGTRTTYNPAHVVGTIAPDQAYNWVATEVSDPHGNKVLYDWGMNINGCCSEYPVSIRYHYPAAGDRQVLKLWWQPRNDIENIQLPVNSHRVAAALRTIAVYSPEGNPVRAYALSYTTSPSTGRLLLGGVQIYGRDFVLNAPESILEGAVQSGTRLVTSRSAYVLSYLSDPNVNTFTGGTDTLTLCPDAVRSFGDFNGDGKKDLYCYKASHAVDTVQVALGTGPGTFGPLTTWVNGTCADEGMPQAMDFDGDGKDDLVCWRSPGAGTLVLYSTGTGFTAPQWNQVCGWNGYGAPFVGDFNGDGMTDQGCAKDYDTDVSLSQGRSFALPTRWGGGGIFGGTGDFNGDGAQDAWSTGVSDGRVWIRVYLSNTLDGFVDSGYDWNVAAPQSGGDNRGFCSINGPGYPTPWSKRIVTGDFNGDGKTDFLCHNTQPDTYGYAEAQVSLSLGYQPGPAAVWKTDFCGNASNQYFLTGEFNGDGKTDILCHNKISFDGFVQGVTIATSNGSVFGTATPWRQNWCQDHTVEYQDFNADGLGDALCNLGDQGFRIAFSGAPHGITNQPGAIDLLETVLNPTGGTSTFGYLPISEWPGPTGHLPPSQTLRELRTWDGRSASSYSTLYSYEGAKYDRLERRSLGFYKATREPPRVTGDNGTARPRIETLFAQDYGSITKPLWISTFDGAGNKLDVKSYTYVLGSVGSGGDTVYTSVLGGTWNTTCLAGQGAGCAVYKTTHISDCNESPSGCVSSDGFYDKYGNVIKSIDYGDVSQSAVKVVCQTYAVPSLSTTYLRDRVSMSTTYAGTACSGTPLEQRAMFYDDSPTGVVVRGDVTRTTGLLGSVHVALTGAAYDAAGNLVRAWDPLYDETSTSYDGFNRPTTVLNPLGHPTTTTYDPTFGRVATVTDANGQVTSSEYDALGRLMRSVSPTGQETLLSYNGIGDPATQYTETRVTAAAGALQSQWSRREIDGQGRTYATRRVANNPASAADTTTDTIRTSERYNARGQSESTSLPYVSGTTPIESTTTYDALDRKLVTTLGDGATISRAYDSNPFGVWSTAVTDPAGVTTYEQHGYAVSASESGPFQKTCERVTSSGCPSGCYVCRYEYSDLLGRPVRTNYSGLYDTDTTSYDTLGRPVRVWNLSRGAVDTRYDAAGRVARTKDSRDTLVCKDYDAAGRVIRELATPGVSANIDVALCSGGGSGPTEQILSVYDQAIPPGLSSCGVTLHNIGRLTSVSKAGMVRSFGYDAAGRIACTALQIDGYTFVKRNGYDAAGRLVAVTYPDSDALAVSYDNAGMMTGMAFPDRAVVTPYASQANRGGAITPSGAPYWQYDASGALQYFELGNGTRTRAPRNPSRRWLTGIEVTDAAATVLLRYGYESAWSGARDVTGHITRIASTNKATTASGATVSDAVDSITYDTQYRMRTAQSPLVKFVASWQADMTYTAIGNITQRSFTLGGSAYGNKNGVFCYPVAPGNAVAVSHIVPLGGSCTQSPLVSFGYDTAGNMTSYDSGSAVLTYDPWHRMTSAAGMRGMSESYLYDGSGARVKVVAGSTTTYFFDDFEWTPTSNIARKYLRFAGRLVFKRANPWSPGAPLGALWSLYLHTNNLGSVVLTTNTTGGVDQRMVYSPWGERLGTANAAGAYSPPATMQLYSGEREDDNGLMYLAARYYDPALSRFLAADSIVPGKSLASLNRYAYVSNDPYTFTDPSGHMQQTEEGKNPQPPAKKTTPQIDPDLFSAMVVTPAAAILSGYGDKAEILHYTGLAAMGGLFQGAMDANAFAAAYKNGDTMGMVDSGSSLGGNALSYAQFLAKASGATNAATKFLNGTGGTVLGAGLAALPQAARAVSDGIAGYEHGGAAGAAALALPHVTGAIEAAALSVGSSNPVVAGIATGEAIYGAMAENLGVSGPSSFGEMYGQLQVVTVANAVNGSGPAAVFTTIGQVAACVGNDLMTGNNVIYQAAHQWLGWNP